MIRSGVSPLPHSSSPVFGELFAVFHRRLEPRLEVLVILIERRDASLFVALALVLFRLGSLQATASGRAAEGKDATATTRSIQRVCMG